MKQTNRQNKIVPVLLGADLNCYSVARAFHEAFGVCSFAFGRYSLGTVAHSSIVRLTVVPDLTEDDVLLRTLSDFADAHPDDDLYLVGCTDAYAELIIRHRGVLSARYFCACPDVALLNSLVSKESFYRVCEQSGVAYPRTVVLHGEEDTALLRSLPFSYPVIVKPSSSIRYWEHPFDGMKKVYRAADADEAEAIVRAIFGSGYDDSIIVQDFIPGDDSGMFVLTAYSDQDAKVRMMALGHVLLEEHTPKGLGNHVAILTESHEEVIEPLKRLLEEIGYTGFSNFDIKFDPRDGKFKVFEINLRQGRSNFYVTNAGVNLASLLVRDRERSFGDEMILVRDASFWHTVPMKIVYSYLRDDEIKKKVTSLMRKKKGGTSLFYRYDLIRHPLRLVYVLAHNRRYYQKYRLYP